MKRFALLTSLMLAGTGANAATYGDGRNSVTIPNGCRSYSCMSVTVPGHYHHNDGAGKTGRTTSKKLSKHQDQARQDQSKPAEADKQPDAPKADASKNNAPKTDVPKTESK